MNSPGLILFNINPSGTQMQSFNVLAYFTAKSFKSSFKPINVIRWKSLDVIHCREMTT